MFLVALVNVPWVHARRMYKDVTECIRALGGDDDAQMWFRYVYRDMLFWIYIAIIYFVAQYLYPGIALWPKG